MAITETILPSRGRQKKIFKLGNVHSFVYTEVACQSSLYIIAFLFFEPRLTYMEYMLEVVANVSSFPVTAVCCMRLCIEMESIIRDCTRENVSCIFTHVIFQYLSTISFCSSFILLSSLYLVLAAFIYQSAFLQVCSQKTAHILTPFSYHIRSI